MRKKTSILLALLLLAVGVAILAYPAVSSYINQREGSYAIQQMQQQIGQTGSEEIAEQLQLAREYNEVLANGGQPEGYEGILSFSSGMMGYIQIPKIDVNLPIYHGVSEEVLAKGVGHMPQSAFPVGGKGNHTVLTGHTGLPSAELFTDLTELAEGDTFSIYILDQVAAYQVDQITVVLPSEVQELASVPGKDYCTLVTCTPYGVNSHRLLVRGIRVPEAKETVGIPIHSEEKPSAAWLRVLPVVFPVFLAGVLILLRLRRNGRRKKTI